jgi:peptidoglycan/LPS O-acetylase OafA/YrhL
VLIGVGLAAFVFSLYDWGGFPRFIAWGLPATLIVAGAALGPKPDGTSLTWKALILLGNASYSLYLVYPLAFAVPRWFFPKLIDPGATPLAYAMLMILIAIGVAIVVHLFIEKPVTLALTRFWRRMEVMRIGRWTLRSGRARAT